MLIDSHAHLDDKKYDLDREYLIENLKENKVELVINIGADLQTSKNSVNLAKKYENIYAVVGVHPHSAKDVTDETLEEIKRLSKEEKVLAIGEIGLDYHYDYSPRDIQKKQFISQIKLAKEVDLPLVIHSREATKDTLDIIREEAKDGKLRGVLHAFSGSPEIAREYIKLGFLISIGGPLTFKNARVVKEVVEEISIDHMIIETDSPYLTPVPYRGKRNEPMFVKYVAEEIAKIKDIDVEEVIKVTNHNTKRIFDI
jgi:TatD DNase family protein